MQAPLPHNPHNDDAALDRLAQAVEQIGETPLASLLNECLAEQRAVLTALRADEAHKLRALVEGTAQTVGRDFFRSMVRHLAEALPVKIAFVTECANVEKTRARTVAFWDGKGLADEFEYDVKDTTCEKVYEGETCF